MFRSLRATIVSISCLAAVAGGAAAQSPSLSLSGTSGQASGAPGAQVALNLNFSPGGGTPPASLQWDLDYSATDLSLISGTYFTTGPDGSASAKVADCNVISAGDVRCIISGTNTTAIGSGVVATMTFQISQTTTDTSTLVSLINPIAANASAEGLAVTASGTTVNITHAVPAAVSAAPSSGSGTTQTFTLTYSDTAGASSLQRVAVWFDNSTSNSAGSCLVYYTPSTNEVNLFNDTSSATTQAISGTSATLQNSQCSVNVASTTVTSSGSNLTLSVPITFQSGYTRAKYIYLQANDISGATSGWQQMGSWSVSGASGGTPAVVSVTPNSGSGTSQTFTLQYSDTAGASSLQRVAVWFDDSTASSASSCVVYYTPSSNELNLFNDASTATTQATPGTSTTLQNSQCSVNVASITVTTSGNNLTVSVPITFQSGYTRAKYIYLQANDISGATSGWQQMGSWSVSGASGGTPAVVSVTPNSGSGTSQTFTLQYSDTAGASSLQRVAVWFDDSTANSASSCVVYYTPSNNEVDLFNDASTATTQATPGTSTTLQNSQCSISLAATTVTSSGNNLTLNLAMTFESSYTRAKYIYMQANDVSGATSGWQQTGSWSVSTPAGGTPSVVSVTPNSGSGTSQAFTLQYSDSAGTSSLERVAVWFDDSTSNSAGSCVVYYTPSNNELNLFDDASTATTQATPGTATTLQNSQCSINVGTTAVATSGNTLTLTLAVTFQAGYTRAKYVYMQANDITGATSGWQQMGTWQP